MIIWEYFLSFLKECWLVDLAGLLGFVVAIFNTIYTQKKLDKRQNQAISTKINRDKIERKRTELKEARHFLADYDTAIDNVFDEYEKNSDWQGFEGNSMVPFKELESQFFIHFPKTFKEEAENLHREVHLIFKPEHLNKPSVYIPTAKAMYTELKQKLLNYIEACEQELDGDPKLTPQANIPKEKNKKFWHHKKMFDKKK